MSKHTPGPYKSSGQFIKANGQIIAEVFALDNSGDPSLPQKDNAHLFAAAPEMLEALKELSAMYGHAWDAEGGALIMLPPSIPLFEAAHEKAYAVIAKAEGVSK